MPNRYWIATDTGNWNDAANWSATSGGTGGASVPGNGDTAFLDSTNGTCLVNAPVTVDAIKTTGFNGVLATLAPLTCNRLEWAGKKLFLAESHIGELVALRSNASGSTIVFDPWKGAIYAPQNLMFTERNGTPLTMQWDPVPGATSYYLQYQNVGSSVWTNSSSGGNITTTSYTVQGGFALGVKARIGARISSETTPPSNEITVGPEHVVDFQKPFVPSVPMPLQIGSFEVATGTNTVAIQNRTETRFTGGVTLPSESGVTITQATGSKLVLVGTQNQTVNPGALSSLVFSLDKPAGTLTLAGSGKLRSDLLRDANEIDPRTATLLDIVQSASAGQWEIIADVACRSFQATYPSPVVFANGATLDCYAFTGSSAAKVQGTGTIRVCQGQYTVPGTLTGVNIVYWNEPLTPPATPSQIFVSDQRTTEIDLWWHAVSGATSYVLERAPINNLYYYVQIYSGPAPSFTDTGLTPGATYAYRVKAVNSGGESGWSPMVGVPTRLYEPPSNFTASNATSDSVTLSWISDGTPISHRVAWSLNGIDSWTEIQTDSQSSFVVTGLTPSTTYYFRVRSWYTGSNSSWSNIVSATTLSATTPPEPVNTSETWSVVKRISQRFESKTCFFPKSL